MNPFAIFILVLLFISLLAWLGIREKHRRNEAWRTAARSLGLRFDPGSFGKRCIKGRIGELSVFVQAIAKRRGKHRVPYTRYRLDYPSLGLDITLKREGIFAGVARAIGFRDIEVGEPGFDARVQVKAADPAQAREFLTPARRRRIQDFLSMHKNCEIRETRIECDIRGASSKPRQLIGRVQEFVGFAHSLSESAPTGSLDRALQAQAEGRLDEALELARSAQQEEAAREGRVVEAAVLLTAGHAERANEALSRALAELPEEMEPEQIQIEQMQVDLSSPESLKLAAKGPQDQAREAVDARSEDVPEADSIEVEPDGASSRDAAALSAELFVADRSSLEVRKLFEAQWLGTSVAWSGRLERVDGYYSDLVFGQGPACRATFVLCEVAAGTYDHQQVRAVVQFDPELEESLGRHLGAELDFAGELVRCDGFMRNFFVAGGRLGSSLG